MRVMVVMLASSGIVLPVLLSSTGLGVDAFTRNMFSGHNVTCIGNVLAINSD